ncbi:MAG: hypothetical protein K8R23_17580 [Chthoniobacter sp.]|nr:hypothetical protein [Chthoniobacter sp.]
MKSNLLSILAVLALGLTASFGHQGVELGPNGGRLLDFGKDESMHGEVTAKDGKFHIALLDKAMKPVALDAQVLTATSGDRDKPEKLTVEKADGHFVVPMLKGEEFWIILQFKPTPTAKAVTARLHYDAGICEKCKKAEWLCECAKKK